MADSERNSTRLLDAEPGSQANAESGSHPDAKPGSHSRTEPASQVQAMIAVVTEDDFERARARLHELAEYSDYEDYRLSRESLQIGLEMAGVETTMLPFRLSTLLEWRKMSEPFPGESGLAASIFPDRVAGDAHDLWVGMLH
jgi:hypothetical protein